MTASYFPQGIATDSAFCNRDRERALLKQHIAQHEHVVLVGPRRYGKTSLITQVIKESSFPGVNIDFFFVLTQVEANQQIADGVSQVMSMLLPKGKLTRDKILNNIKAGNPKLTLNLMGQKLEISTRQTTEKSISELLLALDQVANETNKSCVIVFDEFQQIGELKENHAIEAAIRHAVERSKCVSYLFCGSKRHLLNEMFSNKSRPLYHLCELMSIERISSECYTKFLKDMSKKRWKRSLDNDVIMEIIQLTENHPYYVNALCRFLWKGSESPDISVVRNAWDAYVQQQAAWILTDISGLTLNRRKVLTAIAIQSTGEPQGRSFSVRVGLNPSAINKSLVDLQKLDLIHKTSDGQYHVLDPAIAYFIRSNT